MIVHEARSFNQDVVLLYPSTKAITPKIVVKTAPNKIIGNFLVKNLYVSFMITPS